MSTAGVDVFLSHSSEDNQLVDRLAADLDREGITIWYDKKDLRLGQSIVGAINDAIGSARYLLAVLSPNAIRSRWVVEELNAATMRQIASDGTFLIPALIERCDLPPLLVGLSAAGPPSNRPPQSTSSPNAGLHRGTGAPCPPRRELMR